MIAQVKLYSTRTCPYCWRAKSLLRGRQIPYEEIDVSGNREMRTWLVGASGGRTTVPQIFIDGRPIGGSDELRMLDESGELERLLHRDGPSLIASNDTK